MSSQAVDHLQDGSISSSGNSSGRGCTADLWAVPRNKLTVLSG